MTKMTLDRVLQSQGFGTRKGCQRLIRDGAVSLAGTTVSGFDEMLETVGLTFAVDGETWTFRDRVHIVLNKPPGYECSRRPSHHPGVLTLLPEPLRERGVQPVGRLDHDTTGLLLLSDDGAFIHAQSHPRRHVPKVYLATTFEAVTPELLERLGSGIVLHDEPAPLAAAVRQVDEHRLEMALEQGKYHQVKRMLAAAGNHCTALCRIAIGSLRLEDLAMAPGEWRYLGTEQLALLAAES